MPWSSSTFGCVAQSLQAMQWVRLVAAGGEARDTWRSKSASWSCRSWLELSCGVQSAQSVCDVQRDLEAVGLVRRRPAASVSGRVRVDVGGAADALPVGDRAAGRAERLVLVEAPGGAAVGVVVAGHHDDRLLAAREVPEARQRLAVGVHLPDQVGEQPLLLVGLRDRDLVEVDPVGLGVAGLGAEEQVVGADRAGTAPSRSCPAQAGLPWRV